VPATDAPLRTIVVTPDEELSFQRYFVERRCQPAVKGLRFDGAADAALSPGARAAFSAPDLRAIIVCPSNPYLSIDPILAVPGMRSALEMSKAPVVCVSPIVGGAAVKGPTAKIMGELGVPVTNLSIAAHYRGMIDGLVIDVADGDAARDPDLPLAVTSTVMQTIEDRERLARDTLAFAEAMADGAHR
jgi:LPPG:FO 2-phospho-L-lactate transferase